jgi:hypothetical protein
VEIHKIYKGFSGMTDGGTKVFLTGYEVARAIDTYLKAMGVDISGPRTVRVNEELCQSGSVYVDPSGTLRDNRWPRT